MALTLSPDEARLRIVAGVRAALARRREIPPVRLATPITLQVELAETNQAETMMLIPGMQRVVGRVVRYVAPDMLAAYRVSMLMDRLSE